MKWLVFTAAMLLAGAYPLAAADHAAEQQILDSARSPLELFRSNANPFHLEIDFTVDSHEPMPGHLSVKWQSKDHWWSKVEVGGFEQITIRNGEMEYTTRNFGFAPIVVQELFRLIRFDVEPAEYSATRLKNRTEDGVAVSCIEAENEKFKGNHREFCLASGSHELLRDEWDVGPEETEVEKFTGYSVMDGTAFPKRFELLKRSKQSIVATVVTLENAPFDSALLVPPKNAIERRKCPGLKPPIVATKSFPKVSMQDNNGAVTAAVTVLPDGTVGDVQIVTSSSAAMSKAWLEALKQSTFTPAICGTEPVIDDVDLSLVFHKH